MTYSRREVRKEEIFPARQTTTSICFLTGSGADPAGRTRLAFARYKAEAEKASLAGYGFRVGTVMSAATL
jgi:hypothetical protein